MLLEAVRDNNIEDVKNIIDNGKDINIQDNKGFTALLCASILGYTRIVKLLLKNPEKTKIDVNIQNNDGNTALLYASIFGRVKIVKLLLKNPKKTKINVNIQNSDGYTALMRAFVSGFVDIGLLLLENPKKTKIDVNIKNNNNESVLIWASRKKYTKTVKFFLEYSKIKLYDVLKYSQIKEILRRHSNNPPSFLYYPRKEVKYYDKRF